MYQPMVRCKDVTNGCLVKRRVQVSQRHLATGAATKPFPWTVIGRSAALTLILSFNTLH
jgi:hypothetical protein